MRISPTSAIRGFTLVELAVVLIIVALLSGGMLVTLSTSRDIARASEAQKQLSDIRDTLLGFAAASGRLPCPAHNSGGSESFCKEDASVAACEKTLEVKPHGRCSNPFNGFLPAKTLGITPTDAEGYAIDPWNNRIRYAVSSANDGTKFFFTGKDTIKAAWPLPETTKMLLVCNTADGVTGTGSDAECKDAVSTVANHAVALFFSQGVNGAVAPTSLNEQENDETDPNADRLFVSTTASPTFDDVVSWLSPNLVYNRMISSGRLP